MTNEQMPWESAAAWLAQKVQDGGSMGKMLDVRVREDGAWDVVLLLDGGYSDRLAAEGAMRVEVENLARAYRAEAEAGRIEPADDRHLSSIGLTRKTS